MAHHKATKMALLAVLFAVCWNGAAAQTGCARTLMGLSPCLNYVTGNSSSPSASCCSQLSTVVAAQPQCLCLLLNGTASSYGYNINQTLALSLPTACGVQTAPASRCNAPGGGPSASPDTRQSPPADSSKEPSTNIPSGSKSGPSVNGGHIGETSIRAPVIFLLFLATYALSVAGF